MEAPRSDLEDTRTRSPKSCGMFDQEYSVKRQRFSIVQIQNFHHPMFDEVDACGDDEDLTTIHVLNDDCLDLILSHFKLIDFFHLCLVCRRWYNLCTFKISCSNYFSTETFDNFPTVLWNRLLREIPIRRFSDVLSVLSLNHRNLTTLSLSNIACLDAKDLSFMGDILPNLRDLELELELNDAMSQIIGEKFCTNIESLMLQSSHLNELNHFLLRFTYP